MMRCLNLTAFVLATLLLTTACSKNNSSNTTAAPAPSPGNSQTASDPEAGPVEPELHIDLAPPEDLSAAEEPSPASEPVEDVEVPPLFRSLGRALGKGVSEAVADSAEKDVQR